MTLETRFKLMMGYHWSAVIASIVGSISLFLDAEREIAEVYYPFGCYFFAWFVWASVVGAQAHHDRRNGMHRVSLAHRVMYWVCSLVEVGSLLLIGVSQIQYWSPKTVGWDRFGAAIGTYLGIAMAVIALPIVLMTRWASRKFASMACELENVVSNTKSATACLPNP
jgi:cobalamin synthase